MSLLCGKQGVVVVLVTEQTIITWKQRAAARWQLLILIYCTLLGNQPFIPYVSREPPWVTPHQAPQLSARATAEELASRNQELKWGRLKRCRISRFGIHLDPKWSKLQSQMDGFVHRPGCQSDWPEEPWLSLAPVQLLYTWPVPVEQANKPVSNEYIQWSLGCWYSTSFNHL